MATITFNGESFEVDHAVKGEDYVHGYDAEGICIISIDGVSDFSDITYDGVYMDPRECMAEPCNSVKYCGGFLKTADGAPVSPWTVIWENAKPTSSFSAQTLTIDGMENYNLFMIEALSSDTSSSNPIFSIHCYVPTMGATQFELIHPEAGSGTWGAWFRGVVINRTAKTIKFGTAYWSEAGETSPYTNLVKPYYILATKV